MHDINSTIQDQPSIDSDRHALTDAPSGLGEASFELTPDRVDGGVEPKLPIVIVIDTSESMTPVIRDISDMLPSLGAALRQDPLIAQTAVTSVITFNSSAQVVARRAYLADGQIAFPELSASDMTNYHAALSVLRDTLTEDVVALKAEHGKAYRPLAFFVTDGNPNVGPDWHEVWDEFSAPGSPFRYRPNLVSIGFGQATRSTLEELTNIEGGAWMASTSDPSEIVAGIRHIIFHTVLTGLATGVGGARPAAVAPPRGFLNLDPM